MSPNPSDHAGPLAGQLALRLHEARLAALEVPRLTLTHPALDLPEAYRIQAEGIRLREKAGEKVVAYKMGLTSEGKRRQMGLHEAIFGVLTDRMQLRAGEPYRLRGRIHPKAEPEIALRISKALSGPISADDAWAIVDQVAPAIEVLDSRFVGFKYFSLPDVVADNASSSDFLIGPGLPKPAHWRDLESWRLSFSSPQSVSEALGAEISGSPIRSLMDLSRLAADQGEIVPAGSWVLLGAATPAVTLHSGMRVNFALDCPGGSSQRMELEAL